MQTAIDESTAPWIHGEYNAEANMLKAVADFQRTRIQSREKLACFRTQIQPAESDARRILQLQIQPAESDSRRILQPHDSTSGIGRSQDTSTADVQILPAESDARRILQPLSSPEMGNKEKLSLVDNGNKQRGARVRNAHNPYTRHSYNIYSWYTSTDTARKEYSMSEPSLESLKNLWAF